MLSHQISESPSPNGSWLQERGRQARIEVNTLDTKVLNLGGQTDVEQILY